MQYIISGELAHSLRANLDQLLLQEAGKRIKAQLLDHVIHRYTKLLRYCKLQLPVTRQAWESTALTLLSTSDSLCYSNMHTKDLEIIYCLEKMSLAEAEGEYLSAAMCALQSTGSRLIRDSNSSVSTTSCASLASLSMLGRLSLYSNVLLSVVNEDNTSPSTLTEESRSECHKPRATLPSLSVVYGPPITFLDRGILKSNINDSTDMVLHSLWRITSYIDRSMIVAEDRGPSISDLVDAFLAPIQCGMALKLPPVLEHAVMALLRIVSGAACRLYSSDFVCTILGLLSLRLCSVSAHFLSSEAAINAFRSVHQQPTANAAGSRRMHRVPCEERCSFAGDAQLLSESEEDSRHAQGSTEPEISSDGASMSLPITSGGPSTEGTALSGHCHPTPRAEHALCTDEVLLLIEWQCHRCSLSRDAYSYIHTLCTFL